MLVLNACALTGAIVLRQVFSRYIVYTAELADYL